MPPDGEVPGEVCPAVRGPTVAETRAAPSVARHLRRYLALDDFEAAAQRRLPRMLYGFVSGAAETDAALRDNRDAFRRARLRAAGAGRCLGRQTGTTLLGRRYAAPFGIAPMGASALSAYRGDLVFARATAAAGIPMILSASSLIPLEEVRRRGPPPGTRPICPASRRESRRWSIGSPPPATTPSCSPPMCRSRPTGRTMSATATACRCGRMRGWPGRA